MGSLHVRGVIMTEDRFKRTKPKIEGKVENYNIIIVIAQCKGGRGPEPKHVEENTRKF